MATENEDFTLEIDFDAPETADLQPKSYTDTSDLMRAPFPWFGGKRLVAPIVWHAFGDVANYVEPFFGSGAVLLGRPNVRGSETVNDKDGYVCLAPETKVLCADLRWKPISRLKIGDQIVGFDECNGEAREGLRAPTSYRKWAIGKVTSMAITRKPCYRLKFSDGTCVIASEDHQWLGGSHRSGGRGWRWQTTKGLVANRKTQSSWILKLCSVSNAVDTAEAGWLGGFCDGEAHLKYGAGWCVTIHQNKGPLLGRVVSICRKYGFDIRVDEAQKCHSIHINGGMQEVLRFLMMFRPERLIGKAVFNLPSKSLYGRQHQAVSLIEKEFLGEREVIAMETSCRTFVAEGLASHNCNFWRALQHDPESVAMHADNPVNENDLHARHSWLIRQTEFVPMLEGDPDFYDAKIAGWWAWGVSCWIGSGFCSGSGPWQSIEVSGERGVNRQLVHLSGEQGVNRKLVHLSGERGVNRKRVNLTNDNAGCNTRRDLLEWMYGLAERLRFVRVCCGDWSRICGPTPTKLQGLTAVFLDPPYSEEADRAEVYSHDDFDVAHDVRKWAIAQGDDPLMRIALCGYEGEHELPDAWQCYEWKATGGYEGQAKGERSGNSKRERIWFSPHCIPMTRQQESFQFLEGNQ